MNAIVFTFITEISFVALTAAGRVNALAIQQRSSQCVPYTALFDDIEANSAVLGNPVGVYNGINYIHCVQRRRTSQWRSAKVSA